ncbi:3'-5' exonuclease [Bacillus haikouensis]|jgi:DNA polymerase III subunit epsilon|uniref:3'-5' exonuclease n=1 Tax=Bacillus haikouensis TaxID=1510468 RepID=UPI001556BF9C|nr:3'-5' exonuclease [Bacillus haikouensis]NQD65408.1 3'-5' exonuclease [Bacillus haikouensis]
MNDIGINVGFRILKYYLWHQFFFRVQVNQEKARPSYIKIGQALKEFEAEKPNLQKMHLYHCTFTIFDLETTGFFPEIGDEIISIGAVKVTKGKIQEKETFYRVINPLQTVSRDTKKFTGLRRKDLLNGVTLPVGLKHFLEFSKGTILVAHPASFDINFLQKRLIRWELPSFKPEYVDSFALANALLGRKDCYLDALVNRFDIPKRTRHHALNDAIMTAEIFEELLKICYRQEVHTIKGLHELIHDQKE